MNLKEFEEKYNIESIVMEESLEASMHDKELRFLFSAVESLEIHLDKLNSIESQDPDLIPETVKEVTESFYYIKQQLRDELDMDSKDLVSLESIQLQPYHVYSCALEDITETIKEILFRIKEFLLFIGRHIVNLIKKVGWALLDVPGDAKVLRAKLEDNVRSSDRINDHYGEKVIDWMKKHYPSLMYLASPSISKNPNAIGLSKIIPTFTEQMNDLEVPDLSSLHIGDSVKFSGELFNFFKSANIDLSDLYFSRPSDIKNNVLTIEGVDVNGYNEIETIIYNVDMKYIYYFIMCGKENGQCRFIISKARIETFRSPQIRALQMQPIDCNLMVNNNPLDFCSYLLDKIISEAPKVHKTSNKIPGLIKKNDTQLRQAVQMYTSKGQSGDIVQSLRSYSGFLKSLYKNYYQDFITSRLNTFSFYYKLCSVIYSSVVGSKKS